MTRKWRHMVFFVPVGASVSLVAWLGLSLASLPSVDFLRDPAVSFAVPVMDWDGKSHLLRIGPENPFWTPFISIPEFLKRAVVTAEDFNFYHHRGVDWEELRIAVGRDLRERRFARGASTITQQLAKNLFLSREKTLARKIRELFLSRRLEKALSKQRILELYLNVVEMGPGVYSVGHASRHYFGKTPAELTLRESTFLVAMLPSPRIYNPYQRLERVLNRSDRILGIMARAGRITEEEYWDALVELPVPLGMEREAVLEMLPERVEKVLPHRKRGREETLERPTLPGRAEPEITPLLVMEDWKVLLPSAGGQGVPGRESGRKVPGNPRGGD